MHSFRLRVKSNLFFFSLLTTANCVYAQWSTSPYADSGLYVCPGFQPGIVTFDDGSSIVLGLLSSYIYAQKLDAYGNKVWSQPVMVFHNDSSDMSDMTISDNVSWYCSDGDGGVILFWQDYRGAYAPPFYGSTYQNNTTHIQRVDKYGNVMWGADGITVSGLSEGFSTARIASDGDSGCVVLLSQVGYGYPGAPNENHLNIARYDGDGIKLWQTVLDSSSNSSGDNGLNYIKKGGRHYYLSFYDGGEIREELIKDDGDISSYKGMSLTAVLVLSNGNVFFEDYSNSPSSYKLSMIDSKGDTLWEKTLDSSNYTNGATVPDSNGGLYDIYVRNDTVMHIDPSGNFTYNAFKEIVPRGTAAFGGPYYPDGRGGIISIDLSTAWRYDGSGRMVWPDSVIFFVDPLNAYSPYYAPDNNGGMIIVYWSRVGGIFAQHTGRGGKLGVITWVKLASDKTPNSFELYQNYPNPFNPTTTISFQLSAVSRITLMIYDILGREVRTLVNEKETAGPHAVLWDGTDQDGRHVASGVYYYQLTTLNGSITKKAVLVK